MEVLLGFAVGYWLGTRHGQQGMQRSLDTAREIWESPQTRELAREALSACLAATPVGGMLPGKRGDDSRLSVRGVVEEIIDRRSAHRSARAA